MPIRLGARLAALGAAAAGLTFVAAMPLTGQVPSTAPAPAATAPQEDDLGVEVQTRGPLHEAFAEPLAAGPQATLVVPKRPPDPIEEIPPDQKPVGRDVRWIPGYWGWDDDRDDFLWISGLWRDVPPGRRWAPGYWSEVADGWGWTSGYWAAAAADPARVEYLPEPPESLENGPTSPAPAAGSAWVPGQWAWRDGRYAWQAGTWTTPPADWVWMPPQYVNTPGGYVYNGGYWDYPLARRGLPFAPAYLPQGVYNRPNFAFTPGVALLAGALGSALFTRQNYGHYYFGDYYAPAYAQSGIVPYYNVVGGRNGFDPLFAHQVATRRATDPRWEQNLRDEYRRRAEREDLRPARTFDPSRGGVNPAALAAGAAIAAPLAAFGTRRDDPIRLQRVDESRRAEQAKEATRLREAREERKQAEANAQAKAKAAGRPGGDLQPTRFDRPKRAGAGAGRPDPRPAAAERPEPPLEPTKRQAEDRPDRPNAKAQGRNEPPPRPKAEPRPDTPRPKAKAEPRPQPPQPRAEPRPEPPKPAPAAKKAAGQGGGKAAVKAAGKAARKKGDG